MTEKEIIRNTRTICRNILGNRLFILDTSRINNTMYLTIWYLQSEVITIMRGNILLGTIPTDEYLKHKIKDMFRDSKTYNKIKHLIINTNILEKKQIMDIFRIIPNLSNKETNMLNRHLLEQS